MTADLRPCRPCAAYVASGALDKAQRATVARFWPSEALRVVFPQSREIAVWTCSRHERWTTWPVILYLELASETEDLTMPTVAPVSALDVMLQAKMAGAVYQGRATPWNPESMGEAMPNPGRMYGSWPGESRQAVLDAYRETGSYAAAGRLLDKRGVPTRKGAPWQPQMVAWIIELAGAQL